MSLDNYPLDEDYIDVTKQRADVEVVDDDPPPDENTWFVQRQPRDTVGGYGQHESNVKTPVANDGRSETRTTFYPSDGPRDCWNDYTRLATLNDGHRSPDRKSQNKSADNDRWLETFCGFLDITGQQRRRVRHIVDSVNLKHMGPYSAQESILGTITLVAESDDRWIRDEDSFRRLVRDADSDMYTIRRVRDLLREKSDFTLTIDTSNQ